MTLSYDVPFWLAGVFLFISSGISFMVPFVRRYLKAKEKKRQTQQSSAGAVELKSKGPAKV